MFQIMNYTFPKMAFFKVQIAVFNQKTSTFGSYFFPKITIFNNVFVCNVKFSYQLYQ